MALPSRYARRFKEGLGWWSIMSWFARAFALIGGLALGIGAISYLTARMELRLRGSRKFRGRDVKIENSERIEEESQ